MTLAGEFTFPSVGGSLALDLVNTRPQRGGERIELLGDPAALRAWLHRAGFDGADPDEEDLAQVLVLRDLADQIVETYLAGHDQPPTSVVAQLNGLLEHQPGTLQIVTTTTEPELRFRTAATTSREQHELTRAAAEMITNTDRRRLRRCDGPSCVLVFLDTTRNRSRRWCAMESCGNRAKAAAHYRRNRVATHTWSGHP